LALQYHPKRGTVILVRFDGAFRVPEMVKPRPCVVISPKMKSRQDLCTVVPLSTTAPAEIAPYHTEIDLEFDLPAPWTSRRCWVKGDMIYSVGFYRADLFRVGRRSEGRRDYLTETLSDVTFAKVQACVLAGLGIFP
jgi:mRNA interferase MazF